MRLPISPPLLLAELRSARDILAKWIDAVETEGIPQVTTPNPTAIAANADEWVTEFVGEMQVVAAKCDTLATTLAQEAS